jgi:glycine/D-amino acid oxidase-like deaminating enzyme/nitrite reductase/ring-hydroxylating ferredoxin subunit
MAKISEERGYWNATAAAPDFPRLAGEISVDVAVIGGGIVGVTTARALKDKGLTVALVEARKVGRQVTGKSTAKVTSQHNIIYQTLESDFGEDRARHYAEAQQAGLSTIRSLAAQYGIDCDLQEKAAYTYTRDEARVGEIEQEVETARRLGLPASLVRQTDLPFDVLAAVRFDGQAQFHPTKYVVGLAETIPGGGCHVFESSRAVDWQPDRVVTEHGTVTARHVVMATHLPLGAVGNYYMQAYPYAEPVIAAKIGRVPDGMYINVEEPSHSIRTHVSRDGDVYGIAAGTSFKPGHTDEERRNFREIERWLAEHFDAGPVEYRWVNEDYTPIDKAPFVGWSSDGDDAYLVATGFAVWGITNGTAAGLILAELAAGGENEWTEIFDARRVKPVAGGTRFVKETLEAAGELVGGYLSRKPKSFDELGPGDAAILKIDGENVAAFRDEAGRLHAVAAECSHMGCLVGWNETDRTWDCACHGSRFELSGEVIHGPAVKPLEVKTG